MEYLYILILAFFQNVAFSVVSRSRNRDNITYHILAAIASNVVWYMTFRLLILNNMDYVMLIPYTIGTVSGSVFGVKLSMRVETWLNAMSDSHLIKS